MSWTHRFVLGLILLGFGLIGYVLVLTNSDSNSPPPDLVVTGIPYEEGVKLAELLDNHLASGCTAHSVVKARRNNSLLVECEGTRLGGRSINTVTVLCQENSLRTTRYWQVPGLLQTPISETAVEACFGSYFL